MVRKTIVKRYNAEIHSQAAIEGLLELRVEEEINPNEVEWIKAEVFDVAFNIIGGGEEGDKRKIGSKEEADHSLPYLLAVAMLDGGVMPAQFVEERIIREDVQKLLQKVALRPNADYSRRFPAEHCCRVEITMEDGRVLSREKRDYQGFLTRPGTLEGTLTKFRLLAPGEADRVADAVSGIEEMTVAAFMKVLSGD